jgi:hypothetical protein
MENLTGHRCRNIRAGNIIALLAMMLPLVALAKDPDPQGDPNAGPQSVQITLDASEGSTLEKLLSDLGADVEWYNDSLAKKVISGRFNGSREVIAQKLLEDFNFAIFHDHSRMRVVVIGLKPGGTATARTGSPFPNQPPNEPPSRPPLTRDNGA